VAIRREIPATIVPFKGAVIYQWLVSQTVSVDLASDPPEYFEFDASDIFSRYKNYLLFLNVESVNGTWQFRVFTSLRLSSTAPPHRHRVLTQLQLAGINSTGKRELGANVKSGVNALFAEKLELEVDNIVCAVGPCIMTFSADLIFYN